jgi:parvulin-like peptidyl-prolyl isomerase/predicted small lipoprotein YifL
MAECLAGRRLGFGSITWLAAGLLAGCGLSGPKQLEPANFLAPPPASPQAEIPGIRTDARRGPYDDQPGALNDYKSSVDPAESGGLLVVPDLKGEAPKEVTGVSETVRENVRTSAEVATQRAAETGTSLPATVPSVTTGPTLGEYMTLGAVVVTVNGNPIYANKVLSDIAPVLVVKAKELDPDRFQSVVEDEVQKQLSVLIRTELEFAAAQRNLDEHDRKLADQLTMQWRQQQITDAGGSLEEARSRSKADGRDFDDLVQEQYRVEMRRIYFQKKEFPKVLVSADDMRQFYAAHQDQMFSQRAEAKFSLIKITFDASGGRDQALAKITLLRQRVLKGEDFSSIAGTVNDDEALLASKGDLGDWIERGAFAHEKVEDAVWKLQPGQITPVVEDSGAFYLAKLVDKKEGRKRGFEEADVQALIKRALEAQQFEALRDKALEDLRKEAIIYPDPPSYQPVVEMAMQMYPIWKK